MGVMRFVFVLLNLHSCFLLGHSGAFKAAQSYAGAVTWRQDE